jgi:hypothetical protein
MAMKRAARSFRSGASPQLLEAELDVAPHGPPWEQGELLEDRGRQRLAVSALAFEEDLACRRRQEPGHDGEEG